MSAKSLEGQVALVTGAAKRIGRSIALELASEGVAVVVNYRHSQAEAEQTVGDVHSAGGRAIALQADVSRGEQVERLISTVEKEFGRLDILVNNAGMFAAAPFDQMTEQQWDEMLAVNLKSQFLCAQAAAKLMKRQGKGRIINISSIGGLLAWPKYAHYCVSKAGVVMLTRCLARALAPEITVNSVAPGTIQFEGELPDEDYIRRAPLRKTGRGSDIAKAVLFLAKSDFITGQVLVVDGGRTLT
jgi:3-oxoacyl-[acyl-carrier protein] reductase/pteridine reductase